jgi:uncharacterized protein YcbK (DUF882 family)
MSARRSAVVMCCTIVTVKPRDRAQTPRCLRHSQPADSREPFHVISGYRSNRTNACAPVPAASRIIYTVSRIDIRLPGRDLRTLRKSLSIAERGVGSIEIVSSAVDIGGVRW